MKKKDQEQEASFGLDDVLEEEDLETMQSEDMLMEDPEFPAIMPKKSKDTAFTDVERKRSEIKNSTIGGF